MFIASLLVALLVYFLLGIEVLIPLIVLVLAAVFVAIGLRSILNSENGVLEELHHFLSDFSDEFL